MVPTSPNRRGSLNTARAAATQQATQGVRQQTEQNAPATEQALAQEIGSRLSMGIDGRTIADQDMTTVIQPWSIFVAFGVAAGIGALSGSYPAFRASRLDPIQALRTE